MRRTIRFSDQDWQKGHDRAAENGDNLADVLRRLLAGYLVDTAVELSHGIEYRAVPRNADPSFAVAGITGQYEDVRRLYPAKHWHLEERAVSPYRPATQRSRVTNVVEHHS